MLRQVTCSGLSISYSLVLAAALLPAGLLGDRFGRKRIMIFALALFGLASLACAYSNSAGELIAARAVLGLAAAVILPMSLAVLPVLFTPAERPRAIAAVGGATFLGYPIGPIVGGWLLDHFWWGSVFLINIPVVIIAIAAFATLMPESRGDASIRVDTAGIAISSTGLALVTYGLIKAGDNGWSSATAIAAMAGGVVVLALFAVWEARIGRRSLASPTPAQPARPAIRACCRSWIWACSGRPGSRGAHCWPRWSRSRCSGWCSRCRSTSSTCAASTRSAPARACCR